ncbi:unnamed protein product [Somion occarium]|uniref:Uncharacterized protein n=1 Tax=Somion occarium TaxID=3059160 RepID=A0ABP1DUV1_9APHY
MSEMPRSVITFPRPPPTCNTLTSQERSKLLRSTAKLGQLLGSTPHVLDEILDLPIDKPLPLLPLSAKHKKLRRHANTGGNENDDWQRVRVNGSDSVSSSLSRSSTSSHSSTSTTSSTSRSSVDSEEVWRVRYPECRPPLLRLGFGDPNKPSSRKAALKPSLDTIPGSPPFTTTTYSYHVDRAYPDPEPSSPPSFNILSDASIKREKMRRLTKKLGDGVPVHLVFPSITEDDEDDVIIHSPTSPSSTSSTLSSSSGTSSSTLITVHSNTSSTSGKYRMRHEASHQPPRTSHFARELPDFPCQGRRLTVHYETPEEHGFESETFNGLNCAGVPPVRTRAAVTRKPVPSPLIIS